MNTKHFATTDNCVVSLGTANCLLLTSFPPVCVPLVPMCPLPLSVYPHPPFYHPPFPALPPNDNTTNNTDTPGVHLHHRVPHMLSPEELKLLHPRRRLTPFRPPTPLQVVMDEQEEGGEEGDDDGSQWKDRKVSVLWLALWVTHTR